VAAVRGQKPMKGQKGGFIKKPKAAAVCRIRVTFSCISIKLSSGVWKCTRLNVWIMSKLGGIRNKRHD